jgi:hypothetical protein
LGQGFPGAAQNGSTILQGAAMKERRAKLIAGATVVGLGALGGVAMQANPGIPTTQLASTQSGAIVTSASGAVTAQPVAATASTRPPIVTRASGGAAPVSVDD